MPWRREEWKRGKFTWDHNSQESSGLCKGVQNSLHRWEKPSKGSVMARAAVGSLVLLWVTGQMWAGWRD